ncbi:hypothetical protein Bca101_058003 [Brassica carinata]
MIESLERGSCGLGFGCKGSGFCQRSLGEDTHKKKISIFRSLFFAIFPFLGGDFLFPGRQLGRIKGSCHVSCSLKLSLPVTFVKMNPECSMFPAASVGGHRALRTGDEAAPMAPLKQRCSYLLDDGPRSRVRGEDLVEIRRRYMIPPSVGIRNPSEFDRAPDGGVNEVAIYEAYLEAGMRGCVPSIVAEVKPGFYFLRLRDGTPLVGEPLRGAGGDYPFGDDWDNRYVFMKVQEPIRYPTFWRIVDVSRPLSFSGEVVAKLVMNIPLQFR